MPVKRILWSLAVALLLDICSFAQVTLSTVRGTVTDQSGAVLPNAEITLVDRATNTIARKLASAADGNFEIPDIRSGSYRLTAALKASRHLSPRTCSWIPVRFAAYR